MSKITQEKKKKLDSGSVEGTETKTSSKGPNHGKCCTCTYYPKHKNGEAQPCKVSKKHVARKAEHSECYKCKFS